MAIQRLEVSNPIYSPDNTHFMTVHSSHLERRHDISVYNVNTQAYDVPIIILLHGVYGNHWVWMNLGGVHHVYEDIKKSHNMGEFILVMPSDGGLHDGSAYLPTRINGNYEQWIMDDVITSVVENVAGATANSRIYLTGLSMGGYGALRLGVKYPDKISGISAHSSITQLPQIHQFTNTPLHHYECQEKQEDNILYWAEKNAFTLPPLRFDCGQDDDLVNSNIALHHDLTELNIPHQFEVFPGGHSWPYWNEHIKNTLLFFHHIEYET